VLIDLIVTPERMIDCRAGRRPRPAAEIVWLELTEEKIAAIPLGTKLRARHARDHS
jgi:5-formyltetrahydrofolate cyclo-ligase